MSQKQPDIEETWSQVGPGVEHVLKKLEEGLSAQDYMNIYTKIHDYCTMQKSSLEHARNLDHSSSSEPFIIIIFLTEFLSSLPVSSWG